MGAEEDRGGRGRRVLGWSLVAVGALSILDFFSPVPIPTIGGVAILSGAILVAGGLGLVYLRGGGWKRLAGAVSGGRLPGGSEASRPLDPLVPVSILRLAREKGGVLSVSTVAMELGLPLDVAEAGLDECARRGAAASEYDEAKSTTVYRFPEFLPPADRPRLP